MPGSRISYEEFGVRLVTAAVTPARVARQVADVAGDTIEIGPMAAGPGGVATARATGRVEPPDVEHVDHNPLAFVARLSIALALEIDLAGRRHEYRGRIELPLRLSVLAAEPLSLVVDVDEVEAADVRVRLDASGMRAKVLGRVGGIDEEVRGQVVRVVQERVQSDAARAARTIDVLALVDQAWPAG